MPGISMKEDMEGAGRVSTAIGENGTHGLEICTFVIGYRTDW
jgi:hypothetical protein